MMKNHQMGQSIFCWISYGGKSPWYWGLPLESLFAWWGPKKYVAIFANYMVYYQS